ncbi:hypothetical protein OKA04_11075 [Luteolibacter flavescens]|uniref:Secreted protein n=1 Tax=Luteolibacter flavescens TaxID=1859460 RepID=A0ABT3FNZ6_9BACT|nr:hypothetical protein [Luteolibacter flavescens]MCW1885272.1 hypothetical protein [Luteolibacter flavescens]
MKTRTILMSAWLLGLAVVAGEEAKQPEAAAPPKPEIEMAPEDTEALDGSTNDPFAPGGVFGYQAKIPAQRGKEARQALQLRLEVWDIATKKLAGQVDEVHAPGDLATLRKDLLADDSSILIHSFLAATDEKSRTLNESILEFIYPTEYEPPVGPPSQSAERSEQQTKETAAWQRWLDAAGKYSVPTSFETRNTGATLEAVVQPVQVEEKTWDVSLAFDSVSLSGMISYGADDLLIEMPAFSSIRTSGLIRMCEGEWRIKAIQEAPRTSDGKATGRSWLTLVRVDRAR